MENVPSVVSVAESVEHELAFAMGEDDSGLNYAYIIHLPADVMQVHEPLLEDNVPEQDTFTVETKQVPNIFQDEARTEIGAGTTILLPSVSDDACDTIADMVSLSTVSSMSTVSSDTPPDIISDNSSVSESRPIQIQYLESGIFLHDGQKCEVENLNVDNQEISTSEVDVAPVALDTPNSDNVTTGYNTFSELSDQENISSELVETELKNGESLPCGTLDFSSSTETIKIEKPETKVEPEIIMNDSLVRTDGFVSPKKPIRTYGKLTPGTLPVSTTSLKDASNATVAPSETRSIQFDKIARELQPVNKKESSACSVISVSKIKVIQSQRITLNSRPRKRRLIIDVQKQIPIPEFKRQLLNTKDIVHERIEIAPGTRKTMKCLESGGVAQFFSSPGRPIVNIRLCRLFNNHLVMIADTDSSSPEFANVEPLNADLRIPNSTENEACDMDDFTGNRKLATQPSKRLINVVGKQQVCYFKGLRKPPVFKEYKKIQRDLATPNGTRKVVQYKKKSTINISASSVEDMVPPSNSIDSTVKVEEVVYTVEDGESVVLKSHAIVDGDFVENCDSVNDLMLKTSDEDAVIEEMENENHCSDDTSLVVCDNVNISEPKIDVDAPETVQFPTSSVAINFCNGDIDSSNFEVQNTDNKLSVDLQIEDDLNKLWSYEISSS